MTLIEIDDRDVYNYITSCPTAPEDTLKQWLMELKANNPTTNVITLGNSVYQLELPTIICVGSNVDTRFNIPHMHELISVETKHTDSNAVNSDDALSYSLSKRHHPNLWMLLLNIGVTYASDILDEYIDYYMKRGEYLIKTNTTNTDLLHISIIVKITGV